MEAVTFRLRVFLGVLFAVLLTSTLGFAFLEGLPMIDALYFSVVTVATVGYGDIHPATPTGKVLAVVLIITGVGTFLGVIANATELLLEKRNDRLRKERLSMVVSLFYSEIGTRLIRLISSADPDLEDLRNDVMIDQGWSDSHFRQVCEHLQHHEYKVDRNRLRLEEVRDFLSEKSGLLLRFLENPNLIEHESFTDLLRAVFHLKEELLHREDLSSLPESDRQHLAFDAKRAYPLLVMQWISHMEYLKESFPYLFSLASRTNPFVENPSVIVR